MNKLYFECFKRTGLLIVLSMAFCIIPLRSMAQERLYVPEFTLKPGGETDYFTIALENGAHDNYTGFQFDLVLPAGLELSYCDGEAVYISEEDAVYPTKRDDHAVVYEVHPGFVRVICYSPTSKLFASTEGNLVDIYVTPTPYLKPGDVDVTLLNVTFARKDGTAGLREDELHLEGLKASNTSKLTLNVSATNKYSTCILPFDAAIPSGVKAYSCSSTNGEYLLLEKQESFKAYTPYILYAENGYNSTLTGEVDASKYSATVTDGYLTGTVVTQEIGGGNGYYVMQNQGEGVMFYKVGDVPFSIPAGRCWLTLPAELQGSAKFRMDGTTGIEELKGENGEVNTIYDLTGRRIEQINTPGIYIVDGVKRVVK